MAREQPKMELLAERWRRAADAAQSPLDMQESRDRLLAAQRTLSRRRRTGRVSDWRWLAAATLTIAGVAVALFWRFGSTPYTFTVDGRPASVGAHLAADTAEELLRFSEGSTIVLAREVTRSTSSSCAELCTSRRDPAIQVCPVAAKTPAMIPFAAASRSASGKTS